MVLIRIPSGQYQMGSEDGDLDETPVHRVILSEYLIGKYEVTNAQFRAFCQATQHPDPPQSADGWGYANSFTDQRYDLHPVVDVSWEAARAYCKWAGLRLPTEAEWEFTAKGSDGRKYPWGNDPPDGTRANYGKLTGKGDYTRRVGSYPKGASPFGALDLSGNVWEWCADWYHGGYYGQCPVQDPCNEDLGSRTYRVVRGGAWYLKEGLLRASKRPGVGPGLGYLYVIGFRVATSSAP